MQPGDKLDGYTILRLIGSGGYGEVWLCRADAVGDLRALKFLPATGPELLEKEFRAIGNYRKAAARLRSPHLMPIEHVNRTAAGLHYVMPLADGTGGTGPTEHAWRPLTLAALIAEKAGAATWFSCGEIAGLMRPVLQALQILADAGLVHRDVKPDNILFFGGHPCLADISLLDEDSATLTRRGTPGYQTPSWYAGGNPDMFGAAATLYTLLTGNQPDRMGRSAFNGPPQGEASLTQEEQAGRKRLHAVIRRAADERSAERFPDFQAMADALDGTAPVTPARRWPVRAGMIAVLALMLLTAGMLVQRYLPDHTDHSGDAGTHPQPDPQPVPSAGNEEAVPELTDEQRADYTALAAMVQGYLKDREYANALATVDTLLSTYPQARIQPSYSIYRALALFGLERVDEAKTELHKAIHVSPNISAVAARKALWEQLGEPEEAEKDLTRVLDKFGPNSFILFQRTDLRIRRGDFAGVEADRKAALSIKSDDDAELRRLVASMWGPLEKKYPGYAAYLKTLRPDAGAGTEPQVPATEQPADGDGTGAAPGSSASNDEIQVSVREKWLWSLDGEPWIFQEFLTCDTGSISPQAQQARTVMVNDIEAAFMDGDHERALHFIDQMLYSMPVYANQPGISLFRALLLKRLGRIAEMEAELKKDCHRELGWRHLGARVFLWDELGRWQDACAFLTRMVANPPGDDGALSRHGVELFKYLATMQARLGKFDEVQADKGRAFAACEIGGSRLPAPQPRPTAGAVDPSGSDESMETGEKAGERIRLEIERAWQELEKQFPAYAAYLKAHPEK